MNVSDPFIRRPIGTTLLAIGLLLTGIVAYLFLPVASLPSVDFPTIRVSASRPGADPATMAATVAAPLERRLGEIAGVTEITSSSTLGATSIAVQFDLNRSVDGAARDVQAALNAAATDLPGDLPSVPIARKMNPAAMPILILALTSDTILPSAVYDAADTVVAQRIAQVPGVADVNVSGAEQPAIRVRTDPARLAAMGTSMEEIRAAIAAANAAGPLGVVDGEGTSFTIASNDQLTELADYERITVKRANGTVVPLSSVASIERGTRNSRSAASFNGKPAVLLMITKQVDANVIETVDAIRERLSEIRRWIPADIQLSILSDRTETIRASVADMQITLGVTVALVMMVVFVFLKRVPETLAAGVTVPLTLAGTAAGMWAVGFSINNLSLMALAISVGFVVDDAIVMIENIFRSREAGLSPFRAALAGARQIWFTVASISLSLLAAFIPLLFIGGMVGRLFREFSLTLVFAIVVSTVVSLTVTPMMCAHLVPAAAPRPPSRFDRIVDGAIGAMVRFYARTLDTILHRFGLMLFVLLAVLGVTMLLYVKTPKGFFPQDDTGLIFGSTEASNDTSFQAMVKLQQRAAEIIAADPAVHGVGSSLGSAGMGGAANQGRLFISLKPLGERNASSQRVANRLRGKLSGIAGLRVYMVATQDMRQGARSGKAQYQFTLWDPDVEELVRVAPSVVERLRVLPGLQDVSTDREPNGLQLNVVIDRDATSRLGIRIQDVDDALNNAFSQRQISTIYAQRNQYRVVLEVGAADQRGPEALAKIYVSGRGGLQVPLSSVARFERGLAPLVVNHQGQFPSITVTYNLAPDAQIEQASAAIRQAVADLHLPDTVHADFAGDAKSFMLSVKAQPILLVAALLAVYIVLGVLYESLAHPLTIISTLPSAGLGALLALIVTGTDLSIIAFIGIVLLIGIVKKNGIMLVDFALEAERRRGLAPVEAIREACLERFRPILMTTLASLLGAVPLVLAAGPGSELRRPLGITIIGGLIVSQILTLYTTPVIYLLLDRLHHRLGGKAQRLSANPTGVPAGAAA